MESCTRCGGDLKQGTKTCTRCGANPEAPANHPDQKTPGIPETSLEESVERIFRDRGYETALHQKIKGRSGREEDLDVVARRGGALLAIDCKNYPHDRKVGPKEVGDFISKLDELGISRGLLVTSSDFSPDAARLANNNPGPRQLDLWNGAEFLEQYQRVTQGRADASLPVIEGSLQPAGTYDDYAALKLRNRERVVTRRQDLVFHPYFIVEFDLHEQLFTTGKKHVIKNSGRYFIDGVSEEILFRQSENGNATYDIDPAEKQIVRDLMGLQPATVKLPAVPGITVSKLEPAMSNRDVEFRIKTLIVSENKTAPRHGQDGSNRAGAEKDTHCPHINSVDARSHMVYVPIMKIEFESKGRIYSRTVLPASGVVTRDEIAFCPKPDHKKSQTVAVCDACGIAECENDILSDGRGAYYCRDHFPAGQAKADKGKSLAGKFKNLRFGK
ncbi:MAG: restriction endonuclease [Thaumarchaeota archaeon]|nr:restriction endonuclease [Nitrososphaerota archaeon]